ncbi:MAG: Rpp14/Pop5 family protein [Candidatus Micrarchaeaceae archaeon]
MILAKKHRHILALAFGADMSSKQSAQALLNGLAEFMGLEQYALADPYLEAVLKGFGGSAFVVRCIRGYEGAVLAALSFAKSLNGMPIGVCTLKISGTIKTLLEFASENRQAIEELISYKPVENAK